MPTPQPPEYLVREHLESVCRSSRFKNEAFAQKLLRTIVDRTLSHQTTTQTILANELCNDSESSWANIDLGMVRENNASRIRTGIKRLRGRLKEYADLSEASTDIVKFSIPDVGIDVESGQFRHYEAEFVFHPAMRQYAATFADVLHWKYDLPVEEGQKWFEEGVEPRFLRQKVNEASIKKTLLMNALRTLPRSEPVPAIQGLPPVDWETYQELATRLVSGLARKTAPPEEHFMMGDSARAYLEPYAIADAIDGMEPARAGHKALWMGYLQNDPDQQHAQFLSAILLYKEQAEYNPSHALFTVFDARFWTACAYLECNDFPSAETSLLRAYQIATGMLNDFFGDYDGLANLATIVDIFEPHISDDQKVPIRRLHFEDPGGPAPFPPGTTWFSAVTYIHNADDAVRWQSGLF